MNAIDLAAGLVRESEGLELSPYLDPVGLPTIGYGTTIYPDGRRVSLEDATITKEFAESMLIHRLCSIASEVAKDFPELADNSYRLGAVLDFVYNLGFGAFSGSTLAKKIKEGMWEEAADEFPRWDMAGGRVLSGLVVRRAAERKMFKGG